MNIITLNTAVQMENPLGLDARMAVDTEDVQIVQFTLQPGELIPPHALPIRVFFIVLEGVGEITLDGLTERVPAGCLVESPPGADRGWKAVGDSQLRVVAIKAMKTAM